MTLGDFVRDMLHTNEKFKKAFCDSKGMTQLKEEREQDKHMEELSTEMKNDFIKQWYTESYAEDSLGKELDEKITFEDFYEGMKHGEDVYEMLKVQDSLVRERVFQELAKRLGKKYDFVYDLWLRDGEDITEQKEALNEGAGAGYEIKAEGFYLEGLVEDVKEVGKTENGDLILECDCDILGTVDTLSASSYEYATEEIKDVPVKVTKVVLIMDQDEKLAYEMKDDIVDVVTDIVMNDLNGNRSVKEVYGGGWSHSKWDGTICKAIPKDKWVIDGTYEVSSATVVVTDKKVVDYVDKAVQGDNQYETYIVKDLDGDIIEEFDTEEEATKFGDDYKGGCEVYQLTQFEDFNGNITDEYWEIIWSKDEDDEMDENLTKTVNITESLNDIDKETFCEFDLVNMYEGYKYSEEQKTYIANMLNESKEPKDIYDYMWKIYSGDLTDDEEEADTEEVESEEIEEDSHDKEEYIREFGDTVYFGDEDIESKIVDVKKTGDRTWDIKIENPLYISGASDKYEYIWIASPYNKNPDDIEYVPVDNQRDTEEDEIVKEETYEASV